jgi:hypothetical protein
MFNSSPQVRQLDLGGGHTCTVIDNVLAKPRQLVELAVRQRERFACNPDNFYPGVEQALTSEFDAGLAAFVERHVLGAFGGRTSLAIATRLSLVTLPAHALSPQQSMCHRDAADCPPGEGACAAVLYLFDDERLGGTSFFKPRRTALDIEHLLYQARVLDSASFARVLGTPRGYFNGANPWFEQIATVPAKFNRAVFYDATGFHSGQIDAPELLNDDPARGRLTVNAFIRYRKE